MSEHRAPDQATRPRRRRVTSLLRLREVARSEAAHLSPSLLLAQAAMSLLPLHTGIRTRVRILRTAGFDIGDGTVILGSVRFTGARDPSARVRIGANCTVNLGCLFDAAADIILGNDVGIGQDVMLLTNGHRIGPPTRRLGHLEARPIHVDDGAWLSTRSVVLPGMTIGRGAVVAAGAVVTHPVAPHTLVAGVPARPVRRLPT